MIGNKEKENGVILPLDSSIECSEGINFESKAFLFLLPKKDLNEEQKKTIQNLQKKRNERKKQIKNTMEEISLLINLFTQEKKTKTAIEDKKRLFNILDSLSISSPLFFYDKRLGHICPNSSTCELIERKLKEKTEMIHLISIGSGSGFFEWALERWIGVDENNRFCHVELSESKNYFLNSKLGFLWNLEKSEWLEEEDKQPNKEQKNEMNVMMLMMPTLGFNSIKTYLSIFRNIGVIILLGDETCDPDPSLEIDQILGFKMELLEKVENQEYFIQILFSE